MAAAVLAVIADPAPVTVPNALLGRTSMPEPAGIVWSPQLSQYLIVSGDTRDKHQGKKHAAWLFTMSRDGGLDGAPLPILGIAELNDAQALCTGPDGTYFLATSRSATRKGKDKPAPRRLFHLALSGRGLTILGSIDLASAIARSAAVPPGSVDIEALAFSAGQLYVGLNATQSAQDAAYILRIRDVLAAIKFGSLPPERVQRFAEVPLLVDTSAGQVVQGISDMSLLPDGSLVLLGNSLKGMPSDGGGALYWLQPGAAPRMLRHFTGLKPEGVTLTDDGKSLMLVFANARKALRFLREPLPVSQP